MNPNLDLQEEPPIYDYDDYGRWWVMSEEVCGDENKVLDELNLQNYDDVEKRLAEKDMNTPKTRAYLKKIIKDAEFKSNQLKGIKTYITNQYKKVKLVNQKKKPSTD